MEIDKYFLTRIFEESCKAKLNFIYQYHEELIKAIETIIESFRNGNKILIFGNGGSSSDSQHMASELVNRLNFDRNPLPAISLTSDSSIITSISNDYDFSQIFSRQIKALGKPGDVAFGITTSGNSPNVINGIIQAKSMNLKTICLTGNNGGKIIENCELNLIIPSSDTKIIQEVHITIIHVICEVVEKNIFS